MGWGDWIKRGALDVATGGGYEAYKYLYKDPADQQKAGYTQAGDSAAALGDEMRKYYGEQGKKAMSVYGGNYDPNYAKNEAAWLSDPSHGDVAVDPNYGHNTYGVLDALKDQRNNRPQQQQKYFDYMGGEVGKLTNEEELYNARKSGNDPAAAYEDQRASENINKQLAARGRFNSGPGVRQISDYLANANAQRSHQLAELAGGADASRLSRDNAYGDSAKGASGEQSKYFEDITSGYQKANDSMSDTFSHFSDEGSQAYMQGQGAKYEAQLAAAGVDAATRHQMVSDFLNGYGTINKGKGG